MPQKEEAKVVADPKAPSPLNSFAGGKGVEEATVGKAARFHINARDIYGDSLVCSPDNFVVNVVHLDTAWDEDRTRCEDLVSSKCTTCKATTGESAQKCPFLVLIYVLMSVEYCVFKQMRYKPPVRGV
jgi:hypothetical protein